MRILFVAADGYVGVAEVSAVGTAVRRLSVETVGLVVVEVAKLVIRIGKVAIQV